MSASLLLLLGSAIIVAPSGGKKQVYVRARTDQMSSSGGMQERASGLRSSLPRQQTGLAEALPGHRDCGEPGAERDSLYRTTTIAS